MNHYTSASAYVQDVAFGTDPSRGYNWRDSPDLTIVKRELTEGRRIGGSSGLSLTCHIKEGYMNLARMIVCEEEEFNQYIHPGQGAEGRAKPHGGIK